MDLTRYLDSVATDLARATALADEQTRATAERLTAVVEPALRLAMVQLLSDAGAQLTSELDGPVVSVRMEGRDPVWHVQSPMRSEPAAAPEFSEAGDDNLARITLRLPEAVKKRVETLAQADGQSLNTWVVAALRRATVTTGSTRSHSGRRITGWA